MVAPDSGSGSEQRERGNDDTHYTDPDAASSHHDAAAPTQTAEGRTVLANGTIVHPAAERLFAKCPWVRNVPVFGLAIEGYGPMFVLALNSAYFLCKGIADNIIAFSRNPMMTRRFGVSGERYQRLASLYSMGWAIKAFIAMLTDTFAFLGYTKRWYMLISCVIGAAFALGYGLLPPQPSSANIGAGFIFLTCLGKSNVDILSEGHYSRLIRRNPVPGPALVSSIWICILIGTLIASVIQGPLSDSGKMQVGVFISAALQFITSIFFVFNTYGEKKNVEERLQDLRDTKAALVKAQAEAAGLPGSARPGHSPHDVDDAAVDLMVDAALQKDLCQADGVAGAGGDRSLTGMFDSTTSQTGAVTKGEARVDAVAVEALDESDAEADELAELDIGTCLCGAFEINREVVTRNWKIVVYCVIMTCSVVTMVCVTILGTTYDLMYACIVLTVVCIVCAFLTLSWVIAKANVFTYAYFTLYIALPGALDSFYLADEACLPGGPHFSYSFYNTIGAVLQNVAGIAGVTLFTYIFSKQSYQLTLCVSVSLMILASIFDIIMVKRWNISIGIPDHAMYLCGDAILYQLFYYFSYTPVVLLMSRLCPRGSESMVYALMAGFANLGSTMSNTVGSLLIEFRFPFKTTPPCDFSNVPYLIVIGHIGMPLAIIPLAFLLLPRARICDDIDVNGHAIRAQLKEEQKAAAKRAAEEERADAAAADNDDDELGANEPCTDVTAPTAARR